MFFNQILFIFCLESGGLLPVGWKRIELYVRQNVDSRRGLDWVRKLLDRVLKIGPTDNSALCRGANVFSVNINNIVSSFIHPQCGSEG